MCAGVSVHDTESEAADDLRHARKKQSAKKVGVECRFSFTKLSTYKL
jgi:hypothetical protein